MVLLKFFSFLINYLKIIIVVGLFSETFMEPRFYIKIKNWDKQYFNCVTKSFRTIKLFSCFKFYINFVLYLLPYFSCIS